MVNFTNPDAVRIKLLKTFSLTTIICLIVGIIYRYLYKDFGFLYTLLFFLVIYLIPAYFIFIRKNLKATLHSFLIATNVLIYYASNNIGMKTGLYLFFFNIILIYSFLLDYKEKKQILLYYLFTTLLFALLILKIDLTDILGLPKNSSPKYQFEIIAFFAFILLTYKSYLYLTNAEKWQNQIFATINELKESENKLLQTVKDKEVLLAEVYHRVKNNLSVISSLINLQISTEESESTKRALQDCRGRINSMAIIHQKFYQNKNYSKIDFRAYIETLVNEIKYAYNQNNNNIKVESFINQEINFDLNIAIPCGIIVNELLTNAFKHAFKQNQEGEIKIYIEKEKDTYLMRVTDNGSGFDFNSKINFNNSLGLILIQSLAEQLDGNFQFFGNQGTDFRMIFRASTPSGKE